MYRHHGMSGHYTRNLYYPVNLTEPETTDHKILEATLPYLNF